MSIVVRQGSIQEAVSVSRGLPEFINPDGAAEYECRFKNVNHLILIATIDEHPVGFKVGYERNGFWYSWLGGVLPAYRRRGIALALAEAQEQWARKKGYPHLSFKTLNRHKNMLLFAIGRGFHIIGLEPREDQGESRIWLRKLL